MRHFGFSYDKRRKCYFSDKHENSENVEFRKKSTKEYFKYELRTYRWVQVPGELAMTMESDSEQPLVKNIYYEYVNENKKMREYHVDAHPMFNTLYLKMSVRCHPTEKQLIIIGQDESCFKQYSFSKRCWVGPGGEMKLLPKTDGFTQMVSAFVSRSFGVGLLLNDEEMRELNKRRASREWGTYISIIQRGDRNIQKQQEETNQ